MSGKLTGRTVLITGAGSGIGEATALHFAEQGAKVLVFDIAEERAQSVASAIQADGGTSLAVAGDVSSEDDMGRAVAQLVNAWGQIDILVNNAAVQIMGPLHEFTSEQFDRTVAVNLKGVFLGCKAALPRMMEQRQGIILSTSSVLGVVGDADLGIYGATKGAIIALTKSLAVAYGRYGIRANCICPGDVGTPMVQEFFDFQPDPAEARRQVFRHYPLGRIAEPLEVARTLAFLASDESSFITGSQIFVDGGLTAEVY